MNHAAAAHRAAKDIARFKAPWMASFAPGQPRVSDCCIKPLDIFIVSDSKLSAFYV